MARGNARVYADAPREWREAQRRSVGPLEPLTVPIPLQPARI